MGQLGVKFTDPAADELAATRKAMLGDVDALIKDAKLSPEIVKLVKDAKEGLGGRGKYLWLSDHWKDYYDVVPVTAGIATLERVEILSGLKGTERVALEDPTKKKVEKDDDN